MLITVFTPAYNRAKLLPRLYESLSQQKFKDFEWLIIDDGSFDNTEEVVSNFISHHTDNFHIRYFKKENGGKHTAINLGVKLAQGELFFILDSDDSLPADSLEIISTIYLECPDKQNVGGVCGYMAHHDGRLIGEMVKPDMFISNTCEMQYKHHISWDMAEVFKTTILREFPFPEFPGEKFCPEDLVLFRIAQKYKLLVFPKVVYYRDYLDGGLTDNIVRIRMKSPLASTLFYSELNKAQIPFISKVKAAINYYRFKCCISNQIQGISLSKFWIWTLPFGYIMHLMDIKRCH